VSAAIKEVCFQHLNHWLSFSRGWAEFERSLISIRTADGRERARKSEVKFGPKFKLTPHQIDEIPRRRESGESCRFLARSYAVSANTISRVKFDTRMAEQNNP